MRTGHRQRKGALQSCSSGFSEIIEAPCLSKLFEEAARRDTAVYRRTPDEELLALGVAREFPEADDLPSGGRQIFWRAFDGGLDRGQGEWDRFERNYRYVPQAILLRRTNQPKTRVLAVSQAAWRRWESLGEPGSTGAEETTSDLVEATSHLLDEDRFRQAVRRIIDEKALPKAVIARRLRQQTNSPPSLTGILDRLASDYATCTTFALSPGESLFPTFVGATPERLVAVEEGRLSTMALAGTVGGDALEDRQRAERGLLESTKDREEHRFVRDMIADALAPHCVDLNAPETPGILRLSNVSHLHTPIEGRLKDDAAFFDVVDALHPTPAVCGTPREEARQFIRRHEDFDRGLYAGVLGWADGRDDGEADVLLRAALIDESGATLYAGAGITADSDVDAEWEETTQKFRPLLDALGCGSDRGSDE